MTRSPWKVGVVAALLVAAWLLVVGGADDEPSVARRRPALGGAELALLVAEAERAWSRGEVDAAAALLAGTRDAPAPPAVRARRAGLLLGLGELEAARSDVDLALRDAPSSPELLLLDARLRALAGDLEGAGASLRAADEASGRARADVALALARHHHARGAPGVARDWLAEARRRAPDDGVVALDVALLLEEQHGDLDEAERALLAATDTRVGAVAAARLGALLLEDGRLEEAERWLRRSQLGGEGLDPGARALVLATLARLVVRRGGPLDEAEALAGRAAELAPDAPDVNKGLGCVARARGDLDEAFSRYDAALRGCPGDAEAHEALAGLYRRWELPEQALEHARRAAAARPGRSGPLVALSRAARLAGDAAAAADAARRALDLRPGHAGARAALAAALACAGAPEAEVAAACPDASQLDDAEGVVDLALALARVGEVDRARALLDERRRRSVSAFERALLSDARAALAHEG